MPKAFVNGTIQWSEFKNILSHGRIFNLCVDCDFSRVNYCKKEEDDDGEKREKEESCKEHGQSGSVGSGWFQIEPKPKPVKNKDKTSDG